MATLVIVDGPSAGRQFALSRHRLVMVGREEECTFQILDEHMSRRHFQVKSGDDGGHALIDVGSANGVHLNDVKLDADEQQPLKNGDEIRAGRSTIVYTDADYDDAEQALRGARMLGERRRSTIVVKD